MNRGIDGQPGEKDRALGVSVQEASANISGLN